MFHDSVKGAQVSTVIYSSSETETPTRRTSKAL